MNQVMINAAELKALEDELKHLRAREKELLKYLEECRVLLEESRGLVKILKEEVQWALNGYIKRGE